MKAQPGDWLVVKSTVIDRPEQRARVLEVHSADGSPPYRVKWLHDDHESLVFPGTGRHRRHRGGASHRGSRRAGACRRHAGRDFRTLKGAVSRSAAVR